MVEKEHALKLEGSVEFELVEWKRKIIPERRKVQVKL